ncbi:MAG: biotin--[acetyl-CoA-carboxylase] ligase, partial [Desulfobulbaceae bacterium]|nr:biotin--[acetyl-CoA-carboxylase] ligase [Desulfobulbaceae bacterium]
LITLAAGVACATTIDMFYGVTTSLKWPNDIYFGEKKLAGILTETAPYSYEQRKIPYVVVGIGINVNSQLEYFSPPIRSIVTSLITECGKVLQPDLLIEPIVTALEYNVSCLGKEKDHILSLWREKDYLYGKKICWHRPDASIIHGVGHGIDSDGRYMIMDLGNCVHNVLGGRLQLVD